MFVCTCLEVKRADRHKQKIDGLLLILQIFAHWLDVLDQAAIGFDEGEATL